MKDEQSAFKSAADGVVIYFQNWKSLLKSSAKGTGITIVAELAVGIIVYLIIMAIVGLFDASLGWLIALVTAICIIFSLRDAFISSFMMIYTMENFNKEAAVFQRNSKNFLIKAVERLIISLHLAQPEMVLYQRNQFLCHRITVDSAAAAVQSLMVQKNSVQAAEKKNKFRNVRFSFLYCTIIKNVLK